MYERRPPIVPDFEAVRQRHKHFLQSKLERAASRMPSMNTGGGMSSSAGHTTIFRSPGPVVHSHHNPLLRNMGSGSVVSGSSAFGSLSEFVLLVYFCEVQSKSVFLYNVIFLSNLIFYTLKREVK